MHGTRPTTSNGPKSAAPPSGGLPPRYCPSCGEIFTAAESRCPNCGLFWTPVSYLPVESLATLLRELRELREAEVIGPACYGTLQQQYETRLVDVRPARRWRPRPAEAAPVAPPPVGAEAVMPVWQPPPVPPEPAARKLAEWTAARQADILLYVGAFLLSIAALIFVGYQGGALSGPGRFAVLVAYTAGFITLGLLLPRWEQVREAGAVFLVLGALLVPVNFVALRTQVLGEGNVPDDVIGLVGSIVTAALYFTLALRGHGRLYAVPGALASVAGWGALGSVLNVPNEWLGAWYIAGAAGVGNATFHVRFPAARVIRAGALVIGAVGLLNAQAVVRVEDIDTAELPVAYALVTVGFGGILYRRRLVASLVIVPASAALTALTSWWSTFGLPVEWYFSFAAVAALGYLVVARYDDAAHARDWGALAAGASGLIIVGTHTGMVGSAADHAALPVAYVLALAVAATAYAGWRWREALTAVPPLAAGAGAAILWAGWSMGVEWIGCWVAAAALGYLLIAELDAPQRLNWRTLAATAGALALVWAHGAAAEGTDHVQLPIVYGMALTGAVWDAGRRRDAWVLSLPALGAMLASSVLWVAGVAPEWWIYPGMAASAVVLLAQPWWRGRPVLREAGWPYALVPAALLPLAWLPAHYDQPLHGLVTQAGAAAIFLWAALRARGALAGLLPVSVDARVVKIEQQSLVRISTLFVYGAAAYFNVWAAVTGADRAWVYAGLGAAAWAALGLLGGLRRDLVEILAPAAVVAMAFATWIAVDEPETLTPVLALGTAGPVAAFPATRRWVLLVVAAVFGGGAIGSLWEVRELDFALLALVYAAVAAPLAAALTPLRRYETNERGVAVSILSWAPWGLALITAYALVTRREARLADGDVLAQTREWATMTITLTATALAVIAEGARLRWRWVWVPGTAGLVAAALCVIAIAQPENVQVYTVPVGVYLVALGFTYRESPEFFGAQMFLHEAVIVLGLLFLTLPPAEQSFAPGGTRYGLELIGEGLLFLTLGFALTARWLVAGGVLTLTGVAVRWLTVFSTEAPYWLTLGLVGTALLAIGLLLLLQRERWEQLRRRFGRWWLEAPTHPHGGMTPHHL